MSQLISFSRNPFNWFISFLRHHSSVQLYLFHVVHVVVKLAYLLFIITIIYVYSYIFLFIFLCHNPIKCNLIIVTTQLIEFFAILSSFLPDLF